VLSRAWLHANDAGVKAPSLGLVGDAFDDGSAIAEEMDREPVSPCAKEVLVPRDTPLGFEARGDRL
jgi:hypothetical protein